MSKTETILTAVVIFVGAGMAAFYSHKIDALNKNYTVAIAQTDRENFDYMMTTGYGTFVVRASGDTPEQAETELKDKLGRAKYNKWTVIGPRKSISYNGKIWAYQTIYRLPN